MNEYEIRRSFHRKQLYRHHQNPTTLVLDELGIHHGKYRADIAVVNGSMVGYEIKSDTDTLRRLEAQVFGYNSVFDRVNLISTERHLDEALEKVPEWWGIFLAFLGPRDGIHFNRLRPSKKNPTVDDQAVAKLLWRNEVKDILFELGVRGGILREKRANLYGYVVEKLSSKQLRLVVREHLKNRSEWRSR